MVGFRRRLEKSGERLTAKKALCKKREKRITRENRTNGKQTSCKKIAGNVGNKGKTVCGKVCGKCE